MLTSLILAVVSTQVSAGSFSVKQYGEDPMIKPQLELPSLSSDKNSELEVALKSKPAPTIEVEGASTTSTQVAFGGSYVSEIEPDLPSKSSESKKGIVIKDDRTNWMTGVGRKSADYHKDLEKVLASSGPKGMAYARIYSDKGSELKYVGPKTSYGAVTASRSADRNAYDAIIAQMSQKYGVSQGLIKAVMHTESSFNKNARSHAGAQGLMQLMPATARRFNVRNSYDPHQNIEGGTRYLGWLIKRFNGDLRLALAGYNAGEGAVDRFKGIPPYKETQHYVQKVMERYHTLYRN